MKSYTGHEVKEVHFWNSMEEFEDCPQALPDKNSIETYFTRSMYSEIIAQNKDWLKNETSTIILLEKDLPSTL